MPKPIESNSADHSSFWRGQLFLFDKPSAQSWSQIQGITLLGLVALLELLLRPLVGFALQGTGFKNAHWHQAIFTLSILLAAVLLTLKVAKISFEELGLKRWRNWTKTEQHYFVQTLALTVAIFSLINLGELKSIVSGGKLAENILFLLLPQIVWGFYQEFVYRGLLQSELVRRWGAVKGILVSNLLFTFGPLHFYHFSEARHHPGHLWIFAGIFGIGLFFGFVYHRSGNLWIIGVLHGIGDFFIDGLGRIIR